MEELADLLGESPAIKAVREKLRQLLERQPGTWEAARPE